MKNRHLHPIAQQFFDATQGDDGTFLQSITSLLRTAKRSPAEDEATSAESDLFKLADGVREEPGVYEASLIDAAPCTVGEVLQEFLNSNKLSMDEAARQLGISPDQLQSIAAEMMPLTTATVPSVAKFFGTKYGMPPLTLRQWLITGLRVREMRNTKHDPARIAARKKKP